MCLASISYAERLANNYNIFKWKRQHIWSCHWFQLVLTLDSAKENRTVISVGPLKISACSSIMYYQLQLFSWLHYACETIWERLLQFIFIWNNKHKYRRCRGLPFESSEVFPIQYNTVLLLQQNSGISMVTIPKTWSEDRL